MGTIIAGLFKEQVMKDPFVTLRKRLGEESNPKIPLRIKQELKLDRANYWLEKNGYQKHDYGFFEGKFIFSCSSPIYLNPNMHYYLLTFHLSQFENLEHATKTLVRACGLDCVEAFFVNGHVKRVDPWLNTEYTFDSLKGSVSRKGITVRKGFDSDKRSLYFGAQKPSHGVIYEK